MYINSLFGLNIVLDVYKRQSLSSSWAETCLAGETLPVAAATTGIAFNCNWRTQTPSPTEQCFDKTIPLEGV